MEFKVNDDYIIFQFKKKELTDDIKGLLSTLEAKYEKGLAYVSHARLADSNAHEIKKLGLPAVYPHRLEIKTRGRPITPAFSSEQIYSDEQSRKFYQVKRVGVILELDGKKFTLTNPHFLFLENIEKLSSHIKSPGERLRLWSEVIKTAPKECVSANKELLDFSFIQANQFCLDKKVLFGQEFKIVPDLIYTKNEGDEECSISHQLPKGISQEFKQGFLKSDGVDPYYKIGPCYIQISKPLRICLQIIKKINEEPLENRRAFYMSPMERIKNELSEDLPEDLIEDIFFETKQFISDRISHIGKWVPKLGVYVDPESNNPWFPKENIVSKIGNSLFHFNPDDLDKVITDMEEKKEKGEDVFIYKDQAVPINDESISELKRVRRNIIREGENLTSLSDESKQKKKLSRLVAIIKDNIDNTKVYESRRREPRDLQKGIPLELKDKFNKYPHQEEGLFWLQENFICGVPGGLLADDMGLGKTFQSLAFLYWYKQCVSDAKPALIVAPTGLLKNWQDECEEHLLQHGGLGRKYKAYGESFRRDRKNSVLSVIEEMKKADWVLTTYEAVRDHHKNFFIKVSWGIVIFDEIQKIKNPNSLMTDAAKALASDFSIGLTGTPIENSFVDLWCISDCLRPKILGLLKDFHNKYIRGKGNGGEIQEKFNQNTPPFMLRRMKSDILHDLPKKNIIVKKVNMTDEQKEVYSEVLRKTKNKEYSNSLQALTLLRRFSIYLQDCVEDSNEDFVQSSAKLRFLFKTLEDIKSKNEKVLVSITNKNLQRKIKEICYAKWGLDVAVINGEMSGEKRKSTVDKFGEHSGFNILIISPRAGGVGLNIVSANHIIHLERWWNPAVEDQCTDRIFRIGQKKSVFIYCPLSVHPQYPEESFDVVLDKILKRKRKMREETLCRSEPSDYERKEFYREITLGEEMYSHREDCFYDSPEWKSLRNEVFKKYPSICMRCKNKNNLHVDHVKPRCKYPELELELSNLQILCESCNYLKGTKDSPDWNFRKAG